jgi:hypothetical protein
MKSFRIEVDVHDNGYVDATLFRDRWPLSGSGDTTGTLHAQDLIGPLARTLIAEVQAHRSEPHPKGQR